MTTKTMSDTKTIYQALLEAQKKIEPVTKDASNPFFKSNYATLGQVIEAIKTSLNDAGLTILQPIEGDKVVTKIVYIDGTEITDHGTPIVCAKLNDPQAQGSAITYARRYGLMSLLCLSAEDDDGESATSHAVSKPAKSNGPAGTTASGSALPTSPSEKITEPQRAYIFGAIKRLGITEEEFKTTYHVTSISNLTKTQASEIISSLSK